MEVKKTPLRNEINANDKWDLSPLYKETSEWEESYKAASEKISGYSSFEGKLASSFDTFKGAIEFDLSMAREIEKLYTYAHLKNDEDKTDRSGNELYQKAVTLYTRSSELSSFMTPEIHAIPDDIIKDYMSRKEMEGYGFYLEKILRYKKHTLSPEIEKVLAMAGDALSAPHEIFSQMDNSDFTYGTVKNERGETVELSHGNFTTFLMSRDRDIRENAFRQYYKTYDAHKYSLTTTFSFSGKTDWLDAKLRNYSSCRDRALFSDNINPEVYDSLISTVRKNVPPLVKYMDYRKKKLGVEKLHFYDTYVPIADPGPVRISYDEAVDMCIEALSPLGKDYTETLRKGLIGGWVDRYENKGKRSGAYSSGCYDSPPYILLNYDAENINSVYTLIHEAGHSMHSYLSAKKQPYHYNRYTIFVAEVASTFNEILLSANLLKKYKNNREMTSYIINREIDDIRATLYRQTMFAEFEKTAHGLIENDVPMTIETLRGEYRKLLEDYFGGSIFIDDELELEFLRIPHFYSAFYVYKYATGISAAISLAKDVLDGKTGAVDKYLSFLSMGGSGFPIDELKEAGVDMSTSAPVDNALGYFSELVDELTGG